VPRLLFKKLFMQLNCHLDLVSCSVIGIYIIDSSSPREAMQGTIQQFIYLLSISLRKGPTKGSIACARWSPTKNIHTKRKPSYIDNFDQFLKNFLHLIVTSWYKEFLNS